VPSGGWASGLNGAQRWKQSPRIPKGCNGVYAASLLSLHSRGMAAPGSNHGRGTVSRRGVTACAVRAAARHLPRRHDKGAGMTRKIPTRELRKLELDRGGGRTAAYRYIWANYQRFLGVGVGVSGRVSWDAFAAMLIREGLTNKQGGHLSTNSARRIFGRVSKDYLSEEAAKARKLSRPANPSRLPATWQPPVAQPARAAVSPRDASPNTVPVRTAPRELTEEARATLAALDRQLDHRDRFVNPPKRKD